MCAVNFYSCWIISHPCSSLLGSWFLFLFFLFLYLFLLLSLVIHLLFSMELGLNGKGSCAFAPTKAMLANSKLDCSSVMTLAVGQGLYTSCGEDTNKCSQTCKDTIDKVYSVCKTSDAKWELSGSELTVSTGVMSARLNYGDECDAYEDTKEWYKAPAPSTETVDSGAPASSAVLGVAAAAVASVAAMIF